jgi:transcriptional regulator with GAF, ATPase, and Fis domain
MKTIEAEIGFIIIKKGKTFDKKAKEGEIDKKLLEELAANAIKSNQPVIYNRILNEELLRANISSVLSIPLVFDNTPVGAFLLLNKKFSRAFNRYDMKLATVIAKQIYFASKKLDIFNSLERTAKTAEFKAKAAKSKTKKAFMKNLSDLFSCEFGFVAEVKDKKASVALATEKITKEVSTFVEGIASESASSAEMVNHLEVSDKIKSIVCVPLVSEGNVKSVVGLVNIKNRKFSSLDKELFSDFVKNSKLLA